MKLFLLRTLLLSRNREQGFTLPMVIGLGLIMVLLSSISLVQSSEETLTSVSKIQSSSSLAMAELGIARYRELLDNNRILAIHSLDNWTSPTVANQTCDVISSASGDDGWANTTDWRPVRLDETAAVPPVDYNNDGDVTDTEAEIGSYRIVDYVYENDTNPGVDDGVFNQTDDDANRTNPDDPNTGPRGILKVQGQAPDSDSIAQIQVTIPIGVNTDDLESLDPGIWIHQANVLNWGNLTFNPGNLVLYRDNVGDRCADLDITDTVTAVRDPRDLPSLPALDNLEFPTNISDYNVLQNTIAAGETVIIGKPSEKSFEAADEIKRYYYRVTGDLTLNDGAKLISDGTAKVVIYIESGDLNINGDVDITNSSNAATSRFLQIHVDGHVNISGDGNVNLTGLIHAPGNNPDTGKVTISGTSIVNLTGSIWAKDWANAGTVTVTSSTYKYYSITPDRTPKPLTYPPTGWEQQEADLPN
ncbi:MAG: hypothetical protein AB4372_30600 [Xenococcus sp. (in: cyanobacteria)]